jgi:hypothetical protein
VPCVCTFNGISIRLYHDEHPPPHFHAVYAEHDGSVSIDRLILVDGYLPGPQLRIVRAWAMVHRPELRDRWAAARRYEPLEQIEPPR